MTGPAPVTSGGAGPLTSRGQARQIVHLVREVDGADVPAACLHGAAVLGGLRPGSDIDVLVTLRRRTTGAERRALVDALLAVSGARAYEGPARPVELSIVVHGDIRPWRYPPVREFLDGKWLRGAFEAGTTPAPTPCPDLAPLVTRALAGNAPLFGPPPVEVFDRAELLPGARAHAAYIAEAIKRACPA